MRSMSKWSEIPFNERDVLIEEDPVMVLWRYKDEKIWIDLTEVNLEDYF